MKTTSFQYGAQQVLLETGYLARQADASIKVSIGDTVILVTVVAAKEIKPGQDFFPLTVEYFEKAYAVGKIPGGFLKRDGRQANHEILVCRLIDRALRPLFPDSFRHEVQIIIQVMSLDPSISPEIPAIIGAATAVLLAGLPFVGALAAARVGYHNEKFILNPSDLDLQTSELNLVVAGTEHAILMVESSAKALSEETILAGIMFGQSQLQAAIIAIKSFVADINPLLWEWQQPVDNALLCIKIKEFAKKDIAAAYRIKDKIERNKQLKVLRQAAVAHHTAIDDQQFIDSDILTIFNTLEHDIVRDRIINGEPRIDGRDTRSVRNIDIKLDILPRAHGCAVFTRGETQALGVITLGTKFDEQLVDAISGSYSEKFMLHYNFPPFATGECGRLGMPKRREIGHGNLAKMALEYALPDHAAFPYSLRLVSEILESNGSSSMATVCAGSLAMMAAGVPLKEHIAGVAMGLIMKGNKFAILTDILGDEDHLGDMDFKVAGTATGITALQMDIKVHGLPKAVLQTALQHARDARLHILNVMQAALPYPRVLSDRVPRLFTMKINPDKIKDVIGKGGATIKSIIATTGATIDISEEGLVTIASHVRDGADKARAIIESLVADVALGTVHTGKVTKILDRNMGAMVAILDGSREGFVHISQIAHERILNVADYLVIGKEVTVKVLEFDDRGRMRLSIKANLPA